MTSREMGQDERERKGDQEMKQLVRKGQIWTGQLMCDARSLPAGGWLNRSLLGQEGKDSPGREVCTSVHTWLLEGRLRSGLGPGHSGGGKYMWPETMLTGQEIHFIN